MIAPRPVYPSDPADTLADLRRHLDRYPEAVSSEGPELARRLGLSEIEVEAAFAWLAEDGLEVRA